VNLAERIKIQCAAALDSVADIIPDAIPVQISIVVSHTGRGADDAICVGAHTMPELVEVVTGVASNLGETGDVTATAYTPDQERTKH